MIQTHYFPAELIARAARCNKRTVHRRAVAEGWAREQRGNTFLFAPPRSLRDKCRRLAGKAVAAAKPSPALAQALPLPQFKAFAREMACLHARQLIAQGRPIVESLARTARAFTFHTSARALRTWLAKYEFSGSHGLIEHKAGVVGRKPARKGVRR